MSSKPKQSATRKLTPAYLYPDDLPPARPPRTAKRPKGRSQYRRRLWEDHVRPQIFATDLVAPAIPLDEGRHRPPIPLPDEPQVLATDLIAPHEPMPGTVAVSVRDGKSLAEVLSDEELEKITTAMRADRVAEYARRYALNLCLYHPDDYLAQPDYPDSITQLGRAFREEALAEEGLRFLAKGVYPVRDPAIDPTTPWRAQPWLPAQPASPNRPAKPGRHVNIVGRSKDGGRSTHIVSEAEAWLALAKHYEIEEGIEVDVNPPKDSCMAALFDLLKEASAAAGNASQEACDEADREAEFADPGD